MTPLECAGALRNPSLLNDITHPQPRAAVREAADFLHDFDDLLFAVELYLKNPSGVGLQLVENCIEKAKRKAAA